MNTTVHDLPAWSLTLARSPDEAARSVALALAGLDPDSFDSRMEVAGTLGLLAARAVPDARGHLLPNPLAAAALVVVTDGVLTRAPLALGTLVDTLVKDDFSILDLADGLMEDLPVLGEILAAAAAPEAFPPDEASYVVQSALCALAGDRDRFVGACRRAADFLALGLDARDPSLGAKALVASVLGACERVWPTFDEPARARLLLGLCARSPLADAEAVVAYVGAVVSGASVASLHDAALKTQHLGLLQAFLTEVPGCRAARALARELDMLGSPTWPGRGQA